MRPGDFYVKEEKSNHYIYLCYHYDSFIVSRSYYLST